MKYSMLLSICCFICIGTYCQFSDTSQTGNQIILNAPLYQCLDSMGRAFGYKVNFEENFKGKSLLGMVYEINYSLTESSRLALFEILDTLQGLKQLFYTLKDKTLTIYDYDNTQIKVGDAKKDELSFFKTYYDSIRHCVAFQFENVTDNAVLDSISSYYHAEVRNHTHNLLPLTISGVLTLNSNIFISLVKLCKPHYWGVLQEENVYTIEDLTLSFEELQKNHSFKIDSEKKTDGDSFIKTYYDPSKNYCVLEFKKEPPEKILQNLLKHDDYSAQIDPPKAFSKTVSGNLPLYLPAAVTVELFRSIYKLKYYRIGEKRIRITPL